MNICKKEDLRKILYEEVDIDISMAHEGKIPPSWYADRLQDLRRAVEIGVISEQECLQLSTRFKVAVNSMEQISDKAYTDQCKNKPMTVSFIAGKDLVTRLSSFRVTKISSLRSSI